MTKAKKKKSPSALSAFSGFAAQPTRMALLLLQANEGAFVSLELFEDVGVRQKDGSQLASQMKVGTTNPVSDRAEPLWKTFANWVRQVRTKAIDPTVTVFELHVARKCTGRLVTQFASAKTKATAKDAVLAARQLHWGDPPHYPKKATVAAALAPHLDEIFGSNAAMRALEAIIGRFQFTSVGKSAVQELYDHVLHKIGVPAAVIEKVLQQYHGWLDLKIQYLIAKTGKPPVISRDEAWREFHSYYLSLVSGGRLPDVAAQPSNADYVNLLKTYFIRQLELIQSDDGTRTHAMTCYFRAASARTRWVDFDYVREESMADLDKALLQAFSDIKATTNPTLTPEQFGRALLGACHLYRCPVEQKDPPEYFVSGCFHALADGQLIGWHPDYKKLLTSVA